MLKNFKFTNSLGEVLEIDGKVFKSVNGLDLSGLENEITYAETNFGGGFFQNQRLGVRNISMELQIRRLSDNESGMDYRRGEVYKKLNPSKNPIRLNFSNDLNKDYYLDFYLTATPIMGPDKTQNNAAFQRLLIEGMGIDPYIYENMENNINLREVEGGWEFVWEIIENETILGDISEMPVNNVYVEGSEDVGMVAETEIISLGVNSITLQNVNTNEKMSISNYSFNIGDKILFSTERGNKKVLKNGTIDITRYLSADSTFFQLHSGDNVISLTTNVTNGADGHIIFRNKYSGV